MIKKLLSANSINFKSDCEKSRNFIIEKITGNTVHSNQVYDFLRHTNQFLTLFSGHINHFLTSFSGHTNKVFTANTQVL